MKDMTDSELAQAIADLRAKLKSARDYNEAMQVYSQLTLFEALQAARDGRFGRTRPLWARVTYRG